MMLFMMNEITLSGSSKKDVGYTVQDFGTSTVSIQNDGSIVSIEVG